MAKTSLLTKEWQHRQRKSIKISAQFPANTFLSWTPPHTYAVSLPLPAASDSRVISGIGPNQQHSALPGPRKNPQRNRPQGGERHRPGALHPFPIRVPSWMPFTCTLWSTSGCSTYTWKKPLDCLRRTQGYFSPFPFTLIFKPPGYQQPPNTFKYSICRSQAWYNSSKYAAMLKDQASFKMEAKAHSRYHCKLFLGYSLFYDTS